MGSDFNRTRNSLSGATDVVYIGNMAGSTINAVTLDRADIVGALTLSDGVVVNTSGNVLNVVSCGGMSTGTTVLNDVGTELVVDEHTSGPSTTSFDTENLTINPQAWVRMNGGCLDVSGILNNRPENVNGSNLRGTPTGFGIVDVNELHDDTTVVAGRPAVIRKVILP